MPGGNPQRGLVLIQEYGCDSCHYIPGVPGPPSMVGPPLIAWAERHYIAGVLPNTADNLLLWIRFPQEVEPGTVMPNVGVTEQDARDIGAYLFTLEGNY
jgi:cytochrome c1